MVTRQIALVLPHIAAIVAPVLHVRSQVAPIAADVRAVLLDLGDASCRFVPGKLVPIPSEVSPVLADVPVVLPDVTAVLADVLAVPLDVLGGSQIAPVGPEVAPVAHVRAQVALVAADVRPILLHLSGSPGPLVLGELAPIPGEIAPVLTVITVVLMDVPAILANVLPVLLDPPVLGVRGAATQRQHYRTQGHRRQGLHRSLRLKRNLTA